MPGGTPRPLMRGVYAQYAASGHLLVVTGDGKLLAVPFDPVKRAFTGPAVAVMDGMRARRGSRPTSPCRPNGTLVYTSGGRPARNRAWWVETRRRRERRGLDLGSPGEHRRAGAGARRQVARGDGGPAAPRRTSGSSSFPAGPFSRITFGDTVHFRASWTADGRSVVYMNDRGSGSGQPSMTRADGTGAPRRCSTRRWSSPRRS